ncbi:MAG: hypothetical protein KC466_19540, partial [Myxococcales bacterium]|nr:hypothetical protein [Myxococcales bacterium]
NVKRMLAYSSIAHAGYILIGVVVSPDLATAPAILFYLVVYGLMSLGAFGAIIAVNRAGEEVLAIDDFAGLSARAPLLAFVLALCMFSLAGIPPTGGFIGKFYLFGQAIERGYYGLAIVGVLSSVVSVYYYLRLPVVMYMRDAKGEAPAINTGGGVGAMLAVAVAGLLALGVVPAFVLNIARTTLASLP